MLAPHWKSIMPLCRKATSETNRHLAATLTSGPSEIAPVSSAVGTVMLVTCGGHFLDARTQSSALQQQDTIESFLWKRISGTETEATCAQ